MKYLEDCSMILAEISDPEISDNFATMIDHIQHEYASVMNEWSGPEKRTTPNSGCKCCGLKTDLSVLNGDLESTQSLTAGYTRLMVLLDQSNRFLSSIDSEGELNEHINLITRGSGTCICCGR